MSDQPKDRIPHVSSLRFAQQLTEAFALSKPLMLKHPTERGGTMVFPTGARVHWQKDHPDHIVQLPTGECHIWTADCVNDADAERWAIEFLYWAVYGGYHSRTMTPQEIIDWESARAG